MARKVPTLKARARFKERLIFSFMLPPLRLLCDHCGHYVPSNLEWLCSHCQRENRHTSFNSFLHECEECRQPPKSFACPKCDQLNFLDETRDGTHPARAIPGPRPFIDPEVVMRELRRNEKEDLRHSVMLARLNLELAELKAATERTTTAKPASESPRELLEKSFAEHQTRVVAMHEIAQRARQRNAEEHADNPGLKEMADEAVQAWLESHM